MRPIPQFCDIPPAKIKRASKRGNASRQSQRRLKAAWKEKDGVRRDDVRDLSHA